MCFFRATAPSELYTLSLHDALPISKRCRRLTHLVGSEQAGDQVWLTSRRATETQRRAALPVWNRASSARDRKSTRLNSSHLGISYAVFCLKKKKTKKNNSKPMSSNQ